VTRAHKKQLAENLKKARAAKERKRREAKQEANSKFIQPHPNLSTLADAFPEFDVLPDPLDIDALITEKVRAMVERRIREVIEEMLP
jgi:Glu-tRNA(Gln) amidotransferase subunit E-like FAD-binding protein